VTITTTKWGCVRCPNPSGGRFDDRTFVFFCPDCNTNLQSGKPYNPDNLTETQKQRSSQLAKRQKKKSNPNKWRQPDLDIDGCDSDEFKEEWA